MKLTLVKHEKNNIEGLNKYWHNKIDINKWKSSSDVDATQKILLRLTDLYVLEQNEGKAIDERIFISNTALATESKINASKKDLPLYEYNISTVQKALRNLKEIGVIKHTVYVDGDGNKHIWKGGTSEDWQSFEGNSLTNRRIVLDIQRVKELLTITHKSHTFRESKSKGRLRRLVYRRPFSLKEYASTLNEIQKADRKQQVEEVRKSKDKGYDPLLQLQMSKFGNFSDNSDNLNKNIVTSDYNLSEKQLSYIETLNNFIELGKDSQGTSSN